MNKLALTAVSLLFFTHINAAEEFQSSQNSPNGQIPNTTSRLGVAESQIVCYQNEKSFKRQDENHPLDNSFIILSTSSAKRKRTR